MNILIITESRDKPDGSYAAFDLRHIEGSLRCAGYDDIYVVYYSEHEDIDRYLLDYCTCFKPDVVLLSTQSRVVGGGELSPLGLDRINDLGTPTVMFWWSIYADSIADYLEKYTPTLHVLGGADPTSHRPLNCDNIIHNIIPFDDKWFPAEDGKRDIGIGFLGALTPFRVAWIDALEERWVPVHTGGGQLVGGDTAFRTGKAPKLWMQYSDYLTETARMKIALNFSTGMGPMNIPSTLSAGQFERIINRGGSYIKDGLPSFLTHPGRWKNALLSMRNVAAVAAETKREMIRARVQEALWCRTFMLEEYSPVTETYFTPYHDYVPFYTLSDLVDKIEYYLEHDDERDRIRLQGRDTIEKYYNAKVYWQNIFEYI